MSAQPDIPDQQWTNPFVEGTPMHSLFERRIRNSQDLIILVDDWHARRGTGKTIASLQLAEGLDQNGGLTWENVSLRPEEIRNAYESLPQRSGLVLDEGEIGASNRQAMSKTNQALREIMSIGRVEQKYVVVNTPSIGFIDKDVRKLADVWMCMLRKGLGLIHFMERNPYPNSGGGRLLTRREQLLEFDDVQRGTQLREVYNRLTREKKKHISGDEGNGFVPQSEHEEALQKQREEVRQDTRNEILADVYARLSDLDDDDWTRMKRGGGVSQSMLGEAVGLSQQQIGNIVNQ